MISLHFESELKRCPKCKGELTVRRTDDRTVKSVKYGIVQVTHRIKKCDKDKSVYKSDALLDFVNPHCTYSNDIMVESGMRRFIHGKSSTEISVELNNGISDRHVRNLSNMAGEIFGRIHVENVPKLKEALNSYILQIDGTTDSEFDMIIVIRDAVSDFTLYSEKYHSESFASIKDILLKVKERFGTPSRSISDMRAGILAALAHVFPGIPIRICLMHFFRDLGKDILHDLHTSLGNEINNRRVKSPLKSILRSMPEYNQDILLEIEQGFSSDRECVETMAIRKILEPVLTVNGSSGYGFPFSLDHLNFHLSCREAEKKLDILSCSIREENSVKLINNAMKVIRRITKNDTITEIAGKLSDVNMLFRKIRSAFNVPEKGSLSDGMNDDAFIREQCNIAIGEMEVYLNVNIPMHMFTAAKHIVRKYHEREVMLFANNPEHPIPRTNNGMEIFFRKLNRNVRKRSGNVATRKILARSGVTLALFQNTYIRLMGGQGGFDCRLLIGAYFL